MALLGTGLIGSSFGGALKRAGGVGRVVGYDRSAEAAHEAQKGRLIDAVAPDPAQAVRGADLIVLAVPVGATEELLRQIANEVRPDALITDVGSTKLGVLQAVARALPLPERFVGGHPLAGRERSGPGAADVTLFVGRRCLLTPVEGTRPELVERCAALWRLVGARVELLDAELHDQALAWSSHLPHVAAFALSYAVGARSERSDAVGAVLPGLSGGGFIDTTRIAASDPTMWRDIVLANRSALLDALAGLEATLGHWRSAIESGDATAIVELIRKARDARQRVVGS